MAQQHWLLSSFLVVLMFTAALGKEDALIVVTPPFPVARAAAIGGAAAVGAAVGAGAAVLTLEACRAQLLVPGGMNPACYRLYPALVPALPVAVPYAVPYTL
jgi:hypothetical protein